MTAPDRPGPGSGPVVAVFVGTRADLGPLGPVLEALATAGLDHRLLTGVAFGATELAAALPPVRTEAEWRERIHPLDEVIRTMDVKTVLERGPRLAAGTARALASMRPDVLVVLGDRWELLSVVPPAFLGGVPIVHLHGGEVTEGAVDERVRHAISKLADQHCVASEDAARRLRQMGEPSERVHVTGAPGLDRLRRAAPMEEGELATLLGVEVRRPLALFTYHPPTADREAPIGRWAAEALEASATVCGTVIATHPGMDPGREEVLYAVEARATADPNVRIIPTLGSLYPAVLATVDVVVGNSSSGIIEAATLGLPVVDVGDRQKGRLRGGNVIDAAEGRKAVEVALRRALDPAFVAHAREVVNPYGQGDASARILDIVRSASGQSRAKPFVDLPQEMQ